MTAPEAPTTTPATAHATASATTSARGLPCARLPAIPATAPVLGERLLRPGVDRQTTSRFGDDIWQLTPALLAAHLRAVTLNFATLPDRFRPVAKELSYALLAGQPGDQPWQLPAVTTIRGRFSEIKRFLDWADERGSPSLAALSAGDLTAFAQTLIAAGLSPSTRQNIRGAVRLFWTLRSALPSDQLRFDPALLDGWDEPPPRRGENQTARIPEPVIGPLLGWALRWVDDFADDVLAARDEWAALLAHNGPNRTRRGERSPRGSTRGRLIALLNRYRAEGRPLPGTQDRLGLARRRRRLPVNHAHLARELHCQPGLLETPLMDLVQAAAAELGVADRAWLRTPVRAALDGHPWLPAFDYVEVPRLVARLHTACWIVVAYLSGMRDSEVKHLRRGCLRRHLDATGATYRRTLTSRAFKGEGTPEGVQASWVVGEPVERAIGVLERLQPPDQDLLFARLNISRHFTAQHPNQAKATKQTGEELARFVDWVNAYCDANGRADRIPLVGGRRWHLTTSQFRRTLAWFIARRPGGAIAGAIAYRHQRVQMFEGYAGTSASGFRAEVEAEQALERGERLLAMVEGYEHQRLGGPAADEAEARLAELGRHAGFPGTVVTDPRRLKLIMRRHDPNVFPGEFVTCVFNPDKALCLQPGANGQAPALADCKPLSCRNVALTDDNQAAWQQHLATLDHALTDDTLAPYVRHRLTQQRDELQRFLTATARSIR